MKPETRIGLLVGLMFIILFGLVLSGLTGGTEPTTPPHTEREQTNLTYAWTPVPERPAGDGADARDASDPAMSRDERPAGVVEATWTRPRDSRGEVNVAMRRQEVIPPMPAVARRRSRQRQEQTDRDAPMPVAAEALTAELPPPAAPVARTYTVEPGDSLIRIAKKVYGRDRADEYKRIYDANRDRINDEHTVVVGQTLVIPPLDEPAPTARRAPRQRTTTPTRRRVEELDAEQLRRRFARQSTSPRRRRVYTVRRGDNLTKIAREVLQDDSRPAVRKLYEANRDKLSSPDALPVGVKLEIPDSI